MGNGVEYDMISGESIFQLCKKIFPICRSLTGDGVRRTLQILSDYVGDNGLEINEILSGTKVFDWTIPKEWVIREAYIEDKTGNHVVDFRDNNLHVMGYSVPVDRWVDLNELKIHVYTQPDQPDVIPYVTSYYKENYGFCMSQNTLDSLKSDEYHIFIDSELIDGSMTYGEIVIPGETEAEIFFSTYICHPSMANNECSGPALAASLIRFLKGLERRKYTYRFVFVPETIGAICYLAQNDHLNMLKKRVKAGFVLTCVGDDREYSIVESRYADTLADRALTCILKNYIIDYKRYSYLFRGSDERQYGAPGVDLPMVTFCRSKFETYNEYHTSAYNMDFICPEGLQGSYSIMIKTINLLENNEYYHTTVLCEPQLGKRGLYPPTSQKNKKGDARTLQNILAYADGKNDLIDLCWLIGVKPDELISFINKLKANGLIIKKERNDDGVLV